MLELVLNLLSVLYLARNHYFIIQIPSDRMDSTQLDYIPFCVPNYRSNTAYVAGAVIPPSESALVSAASTLPLNKLLRHRCFAHLHMAGLSKLVSEGIVTGLKLESSSPADTVLSVVVFLASCDSIPGFHI